MYFISCFKASFDIDVFHMNVSVDPDPGTIGLPRPARPSSGYDLDCKQKLFRSLSDRAGLRILETLCEKAKTVEQIAVATGLTLTDVSIQLERLLDCGCVSPSRTAHFLLYRLNTPRLLQLEAVADEFLEASFKAPEVSNYDLKTSTVPLKR
jgi:DNA-binding transcriptional ArsR family regulator